MPKGASDPQMPTFPDESAAGCKNETGRLQRGRRPAKRFTRS